MACLHPPDLSKHHVRCACPHCDHVCQCWHALVVTVAITTIASIMAILQDILECTQENRLGFRIPICMWLCCLFSGLHEIGVEMRTGLGTILYYSHQLVHADKQDVFRMLLNVVSTKVWECTWFLGKRSQQLQTGIVAEQALSQHMLCYFFYKQPNFPLWMLTLDPEITIKQCWPSSLFSPYFIAIFHLEILFFPYLEMYTVPPPPPTSSTTIPNLFYNFSLSYCYFFI